LEEIKYCILFFILEKTLSFVKQGKMLHLLVALLLCLAGCCFLMLLNACEAYVGVDEKVI
jgi:hypothetical protein